MVTGALSPAGALSDGHDAFAVASDPHQVRMARFSAKAEARV